jgi:hypothetical protein
LPAEQRASYLKAACGGALALEQRLQALLGESPKTAALTPRGTIAITVPPSEKPGDRIGPYKVLQLIGEEHPAVAGSLNNLALILRD